MLDLLIKGGHLTSGESCEIGIRNGKIVEVGRHLEAPAYETLQLEDDMIISYGWMDSHVHCFETMELYYDYPDEIGYKSGVTSLIDAGSSGEANIHTFYDLTKKARTHVYALMNISREGIVAQNELEDLSRIDNIKNKERILEMKDFIIGIKARMSKTVVGPNDTIPLKMAKALQSEFEFLPLMVHIGSAPPQLSDVLELLEKGDIVTHCYNGKDNGILAQDGEIKQFVWDAYDKGIHFDIGHGTDSFNFNVAEKALHDGMTCHTVSSDIYIRNRLNGPVYSLGTTMEKLLNLGVSLESVLKMVTETPAEIFGFETKGKLEIGYDADITIFKYKKDEVLLTDSNGNTRQESHQLRPQYTVVSGALYNVKGES